MKHKIISNLLLVFMLFVSGFMLFACNPEHKAKNAWSYDESNHWHKCEACEDEVFDLGKHNYKDNGVNKSCEECGKILEYTVEENYAIWKEGIINSIAIKDNYMYKYDSKIYKDGEFVSKGYEIEARQGNKYYFDSKDYDFVKENSSWQVFSYNIEAVKIVLDNGKERTKNYYKRMYPTSDGFDVDEYGSYEAPYYAKEVLECHPEETLDAYGLTLETLGDTFEEFASNLKELYTVNSLNLSFTRTTDGVNLVLQTQYDDECSILTETGEYIDADCINNSTFTITVFDGKLVKIADYSECDYVFEDTTQNFHETEEQIVTYEENKFDTEFYNSISVETENTYNNYVGYVSFRINGYDYSPRAEVPVGDNFTVQNGKDFFSDMSTHINWLTIGAEIFANQIEFYVDEEMTIPLQQLENFEYEEDRTVYIKLTSAPEDDAWVISVFKTKDGNDWAIRYIQGCSQIGEKLSFDTSVRLSNYPIISVDGEASEGGEFNFEKGTIHIIMIENPYLY